MELRRRPAASTFVTFPMISTAGATVPNMTLSGSWFAYADGTAPNAQGNPQWRVLTGAATEMANSSGVYFCALAATELPTASPYVMLKFHNAVGASITAATQYLLIFTGSTYADVTGINGSNITAPVTAGYMPIDVKQTISLTSPADNSIEKSLARSFMAATNYIDAQISQGVLATTLNLTAPTDNTLGKALSRLYMMATNYIDAAISTRSAPGTAQTIDQTTVISGATDNSIGKMMARMYQASPFTALTIGTVNTLATGSISSGSFSGSAIDAAAVSVDVGSEFADAYLGRNIRGGSSTGRRVYEAYAFLRNKASIASGTLTVTSTDDTTTEWTATIATEAVSAIVTNIDPA